MEEEEREHQSAKLQELIRRGAPEDLQEANRLMKIMAGYDTRSKTDYRAKAAEDIAKIQAKARLLEERLEAFKPGDSMKDGDVFSELAAALQSAQPKIQKMCEEESEDTEAVARLFEINDSIHRTVERWKLLKKGDVEGASKIAAGAPIQSPSKAAGKAPSAANELSLIDFDGEPQPANGAASSAQGSAGIENDLLGLSMDGGGSFGQGGGISLGFGSNQSESGQICVAHLLHTDNVKTFQDLHSSLHYRKTAQPAAGHPLPPRLSRPPLSPLSQARLKPQHRSHRVSAQPSRSRHLKSHQRPRTTCLPHYLQHNSPRQNRPRRDRQPQPRRR